MRQALEELRAEVARDKTVNGSATTLIDKLLTLITDATTVDEVRAIVAEYRANNDEFEAAILARTPQDPNPNPTP